MSDMLRELYQETIIDHNRHPRNHHVIDQATHHAEGVNPLCGDELCVYLSIENDVIQDISFVGKGCAISTASASLMTEILKNKPLNEAKNLFEQFHDLVTGQKESDINIGKLAVLAGVKEFPARVKCATLAWHTLNSAINNDQTTVTTE